MLGVHMETSETIEAIPSEMGKIPTASPQDEARRHTIPITVRFYTILTHYRQ